MVEKRGRERPLDGFGRPKRRQAPTIRACGPEDIQRFARLVENFFRPVVREEVERRVQALNHPSQRPALDAGRSEVRSLKFQFVKKLPSTLFTATSIKAGDGTAVQIELVDTVTGARVTSGPDSSIKLHIVVLNGDFCSRAEEDWTEQQFNDSISLQREGKRPLVTGDLTVTLREGAGTVGDIRFTDNSSWMRSGKFVLGAIPVQKYLAQRIREARSEPFRVKDQRGEASQKHDRPSLSDEIWRLKHIRKDGPQHNRLLKAGIRNVKDLLRRYAIDPSQLRRCFVREKLDKIIKHAQTCCVDARELYTYPTAGHGFGLRFNSIYQVVAATFDGINYRSLETLNPYEKAAVEAMKQEAYEHEEDWVQVSEQSTLGSSRPSTSAPDQPFSFPEEGLQPPVFPITNQERIVILENVKKLDCKRCPSDYFMDQLEQCFGFDPSSFASNQLEGPFSPGLYDGDLPVLQGMAQYDNLQVQVPSYFPGTWGAGKTKAAWCKIRAAVKWKIVRRAAAARRMATPIFNYLTTHGSML